MSGYALIAEPDPAQAKLYEHVAAAEGLEVRAVRDGDQALVVLRTQGAPALTIVEPSLPKFDGFRLLEELRRLAPPQRSPALVISAFRELRDTAVRHRDRLGISGLLAKGAPVESIRRAVKKALGEAAAGRTSRPPPLPPYNPFDTGATQGEDEHARLEEFEELQLADEDAGPEEELQQLVRDVARRFVVPIALISFVLEDKQWFKAHVGLSGHLLENRGSGRDWSFCRHVVEGRQPLVIPDAAVHPSFSSNPLVQDGSVRSYAGAPLETSSGRILGSLCVVDTRPMSLSAQDVDELVVLARTVAGELELRAQRARARKTAASDVAVQPDPQTALRYLGAVLDHTDNGVLLFDRNRTVVFANRAFSDLLGIPPTLLLGRTREQLLREIAAQFTDPDELLRHLKIAAGGPYALRVELELEHPRRRTVRWMSKPVDLEGGPGQLTVLTDLTAESDLQRMQQELARTDAGTGLLNRRGGEEVLEREAFRAQRFSSAVSVALVEVDGWEEKDGAPAIAAAARLLDAALRGADVAVRWSERQLLAVLPGATLDGARRFAERYRLTVVKWEGPPEISVSLGLAELDPRKEVQEAVARADEQLAQAKAAGGNRHA